MLRWLLICSLLAQWSVLTSHGQRQCDIHCPQRGWPGNKLTPGRQVRFSYSHKVINIHVLPGLPSDELQFQLDILMTTANTCWQVLDFENVRVLKTLGGLQWYINSTMTEIYSKELTKFSMWHRATDGYIDCIWWHDNEEMWVRNFKRGVLDAFQNDLVKTDYWQTGVIGTCHVKQSFIRKRSPQEFFVHKVYDMSSCYDQPKQITSPVKLIPELNLVGSQFYNAERTSWRHAHAVKDVGIVWKKVVNEAIHKFTPFGRYGGGPTIVIGQELNYVSTSIVDVPVPPIGNCECSSIIFEFPEPDVHIPDSKCNAVVQNQIEDKIDFLAENFKQPEQIKYAKEFLDTVDLLRKACPQQLQTLWTLYNRTKYRMVHREIFLDALPVVCTDASVKLLSDVVLGDGLSVRRSHAILKDMHFCNYTTKAMVRHYKDYVNRTAETSCLDCSNVDGYDLQDLKVERWLLLGTLIQQLGCQRAAAKEALDFLEEKLETLLSKWKEMPLNCLEKDIIALIDALGNAGCLDSMDSLNVVWSDKTLPAEIRIAAIRANRLMIELSAMQIFYLIKPIFIDATNPSEVRIAAWDMLLETATTNFPVPFRDYVFVLVSLKDEVDVNVGSYALSWLNAWADNLDISEKKTLLARFVLWRTGATYWGSKFNLDYPVSKFHVISWSPFNSGDLILSAKTRVVYDTDRTLPQSASVELDLHLLGQTIPVFKVEGYMKGASWMLENLFGPVGYFTTNKTYNFPCGLKHMINVLMKPFPSEDLDIAIHVSMLGREFQYWARSRCWFDEYMYTSSLYNITNSLWWLFHDTGYNMSEYCPWTIEFPVWHDLTGVTWENGVDVFQRLREMLSVWRMFYDGTIWERTLNMNATSVLLEAKVAFPSMTGLPLFFAGNITAHVSIETSGSVKLPQPASSTWWPQAVWSHLWNIWNIWTKPEKVEWQAEINPRINLESTFALGVDAHVGGISFQVEMDVQSNQKFQFEGSLEPNNYTVSYKMPPSDSGVFNLASYQSKLNYKHWYLDSIVKTPIIAADLPLEKTIKCTPKELIGVELCAQYQYYNSTNTWGPYYPLNGPSFGSILLSTANRPCNSCGYNNDTCCTYDEPPTQITGRILKTETDNFRFTLEGTGSVPERTVLIDYSRDRDYPTDVMSALFSWNTCQGQELNPVINASLAFSWDRVDLQCLIVGKAPAWEMTSFSWMNRTAITSNTTIYYYENDTLHMCEWKKPANPYRFLVDGSLVKRRDGYVRVEVEDLCHVTHWWEANYTVNQLMVNITMNSSLFTEQGWKFGLPLPRPVDTASCYVFGSNFITFDGLNYAVDAPGSYLLTRGISSDNFTVILHHRGLSSVRELEIWVAGTQFLLTADGLTVNSIIEAIPYKSCIANVTLWDTDCEVSYIRMTSQIGLEIYYSPKAIELSVNGFYFGRLRGLCGNNNNNQKRGDEWQKSDDEVARNVTEFVDSWKVDGLQAKVLPFDDDSKICNQTFDMDSMEPISHEVDLDAFYRACLVEVKKSYSLDERPEAGVCRAIDGVKVASFARDFALPKVCWYGPWGNWMTDSVRKRKLIYGCDKCCERIELENRLKDNSKLYACEPSVLQQHFAKIGPSKECVSTEEFPMCPSECMPMFGTPQPTTYSCGNSVINVPRWHVEKCFCTVPC